MATDLMRSIECWLRVTIPRVRGARRLALLTMTEADRRRPASTALFFCMCWFRLNVPQFQTAAILTLQGILIQHHREFTYTKGDASVLRPRWLKTFRRSESDCA
eukprot:1836412-Amphidinium_carterae.1